MTELVTEMPRCFSTSIQSEVAWRELLRALTVPAIRIAPPNNNSFSVSVVLPASGCEMIAKVRRRRISAVRSFMGSASAAARAAGVQGNLKDGRIFAAARRLVVTAAHADVLECKRLVETNRGAVRWPHFKIRIVDRRGGGALQQILQKQRADAAAAQLLAYTQIQNVRLTRAR